MRVRRTPWWYYLAAAALGLVAGLGLARYDESTGLSLVGAPWIVPAVLALLGIVVLGLALNVHRYAATDPAKRRRNIDPQRAVYTLVLAKALGIAGAALSGWYAGQLLMTVGHAEAAFYANTVRECAVAGAVCLADMIIGIISEWLCQLPPTEGPESTNPAVRRQRRLNRTQATNESHRASTDSQDAIRRR